MVSRHFKHTGCYLRLASVYLKVNVDFYVNFSKPECVMSSVFDLEFIGVTLLILKNFLLNLYLP